VLRQVLKLIAHIVWA